MKKAFILFIIVCIPYISFCQNKQNKYYKPYRFSVSGLTKFPIGETNSYGFDMGIGVMSELIYTLDQKAKYEISIEVGFMSTLSYSENSNDIKYLIPAGINIYYYFIDEAFSPFIGIGYGIENFDNKNKYVLKPTIGISYEKIKVFARYGIMSEYNSIEIGISYSFKERPCGCFPTNK
jgi:hypothetical protein